MWISSECVLGGDVLKGKGKWRLRSLLTTDARCGPTMLSLRPEPLLA